MGQTIKILIRPRILWWGLSIAVAGGLLLAGCGPGGEETSTVAEPVELEQENGQEPELTTSTFSIDSFETAVTEVLGIESMVGRYRRMAELAAEVPGDSIVTAMARLATRDLAFRYLDLPIMVLLRWMELDPEAGMAWMAGQEMDERFTTIVHNVFFNWALNDASAAISIAKRQTHEGLRHLALTSILQALDRINPEQARVESERLIGLLGDDRRIDPIALLTRSDPDAAWQSLQSDWARGMKNHRMWQSFFAVLAETEPQRAHQLLSELPDEDLLTGAGLAVFETWAKSDPWAALAAASQFRDRDRVHSMVIRVIESSSKSDPLQGLVLADSIDDRNMRRQAVSRTIRYLNADMPGPALASIAALRDSQSRQLAYDQFLPRMAEVDPTGAINWIERNLDGPSGARSLLAVISSQAGKDPQLASVWVDRLPPGQYRSRAFSQLTRTWADRDAEQAYEWASGLPRGGDRDLAMAALAPVLVRQDIEQAIGLVSEMSSGRAREAFEHQIAMQMALDDPEAALGWIEQIEGGNMRRQAAGTVLYQWAQSDPEAAFLYAMAESDLSSRDNQVARVASSWANQDPEAAVETLAAFSDRGLPPHLYSGALGQWIHSDEERASDWLVTEAPVGVRDQGLVMLVGVRLQHDAPSAVADALQISNSPQRRQALRQILSWSQQYDPAFGLGLLRSDSALSSEDRAALENEFSNRLTESPEN